jgi:hypothetical protein
MGAVWELVAASTRVASIAAPTDKNRYSTSFVFLVLAPLWINAFDYVVLGRMVWFYLPEKALAGVRATRISTIFVCLDISAFIVQLAGALLTVNNSNNPSSASKTAMALHIYTAGVALQQAVILVFFGLGTAFLVRLLKRRDITAESRAKGIRLMFVLYASLLLITVCVYQHLSLSLLPQLRSAGLYIRERRIADAALLVSGEFSGASSSASSSSQPACIRRLTTRWTTTSGLSTSSTSAPCSSPSSSTTSTIRDVCCADPKLRIRAGRKERQPRGSPVSRRASRRLATTYR